MPKKVIITESTLKRLFVDQILEESDMTKDELTRIIRDSIKNNRDINRDIEKKVKSLVASAVHTLFKTLWQRRNFYEDEIKK